ncbi:hypothetical protein [Amnibacterium kyonggiense]
MTTTTSPSRLPRLLLDHRFRVFLVVVAVVAFIARLGFVVRGQGLHGMGTYDDGVYYAAAAAMAAGRFPYRDFLLLQPPMLEIVLLPFAAVGRLIGDADAFVAARVAFMALGAVNTALIAVVLRRFGPAAAVSGAVFYALFPPAIYGERSTLLEPIGTFGVLLALALLGRRTWSRPRVVEVVAGVALAAAVGAKLWYVIPAVIVLVAFWRRILFTAIGAVAGGLAIFLPFFIAAPAAMWRQLVQDQLGRPQSGTTPIGSRLVSIFAPPDLTLSGRLPGLTPSHVVVVFVVVSLALAVIALLRRGSRVFAVMFVAELGLLLTAQSYFGHYAALTAPSLALLVGVAVAAVSGLARDRAVRSAICTGVVVAEVVGVVLFFSTTNYGLVRGPRPRSPRSRTPSHPSTGASPPTTPPSSRSPTGSPPTSSRAARSGRTPPATRTTGTSWRRTASRSPVRRTRDGSATSSATSRPAARR